MAYKGILSCFFQGFSQLLVAQHVERAGYALSGRMRHDHLIEEAAFRGDEGIGEAGLIFLDPSLDAFRFARVPDGK